MLFALTSLHLTVDRRRHTSFLQPSSRIILLARYGEVGMDRGKLRNRYLMVKSVNPLSVTAQSVGLGDMLFNRLRPHDVAEVSSLVILLTPENITSCCL